MTDMAHVTELLHEVAQREHYSLTALRDWLRTQRDEGVRAKERSRRLDSEAEAVQVMTVWGSKGLQFPVVYLPFAFNRHMFDEDHLVRFHDGEQRCLYIGGKRSPDLTAVQTTQPAGGPRRGVAVVLRGADSGPVAGGGVVGAQSGTSPTGACRACCAGGAPASPRYLRGATR